MPTVVIDPGHGGTGSVGGSDGNHAVKAGDKLLQELDPLDLLDGVQNKP